MVAPSTSASFWTTRARAISRIIVENSATHAASSSSLSLHGFNLFSNSAVWLFNNRSADRDNFEGSTTAESGASRPSDSLNRFSNSSRAVIISTFTKASLRPMAMSRFSLNASAKLVTTCAKLDTLISMPSGAEGRGKSSVKKRSRKSSSKDMKSGSKCWISPVYAGLVTLRPGCGRPVVPMLRKVLAKRSTLGRASSGTLLGSKWSPWCSSICARQSSMVKPSS
mmetsp:Transcript_111845/g.312683  ORF Transcript_111845/g.312683 Transcript_111845/m.312683 type:complete len:225 (-) Transcript_111845:623-1297(-)